MDELDLVISTFAKEKSNVFFVQIGAGDGVTHDPIYEYVLRYKWSGLLVEPVAYVYERLRENYRDSEDLIFENCAVDTRLGVREIWYLAETEDSLPFWYHQLGSFFPQVVLKHVNEIPAIDNYVVRESIRCETLASLFEKHQIDNIDLLSIDVEGYDFTIIQELDFSLYHPEVIIYEQIHLDELQRRNCLSYLSSKGYKLYEAEFNTVAYSQKLPVLL